MTEKSALHPISTLTATQFLHQIEAIESGVAVFDCDGTLWSGDAGVGFMQWSIETGLLSAEAAHRIDDRYQAYLRGQVSELAICGEMAQIYRGLMASDVRQAARTYFDTVVRPQIFPDMEEACRRLRDKGVAVWAVSSTNTWLIEEAARDFDIPSDRVLAVQLRIVDGRITDEVLDVPTDEGKAQSLVRSGVTHPDAVFGNSIHDAAMLAIARRPFVVNPTLELAELAGTRGWPVFQPQATQI